MEVEIKINLLSQESHAKVASALGTDHLVKYEQENFFFDGCEGELSSQRATLRVRIYNTDEKAELTLKGKAVMKEGVGTAPELEEQLDVQFARTVVSEPQQLLTLDSVVMKDVKAAFALESLKCLGGFWNTRNVYTWNDHKLELDETHFDFGTMYELECETNDPETLKPQLEEYLRGQGVDYKYSTTTKFARFLKKTLE